jgi:sugar phosphate isomerase/epimerase
MIRAAVTVSLVSEARGGPFVFWDDLPYACQKAAELGFHGIEVFAPGADALDAGDLRRLLDAHGLRLAALGTGAGWLRRKLDLTNPDEAVRLQARSFIATLIELGGQFAAPAIIGSMQGRWRDGVDRPAALTWLREALDELGRLAERCGTMLLIEPINRYETNLLNSLADGAALVDSLSTGSVRLLADLFHMNIEEVDLPAALLLASSRLGHVHFVDSNRRPAGCGNLDFAPIAAALRQIGYDGYVSVEALPYPNPDEAARLTMAAYQQHFAANSPSPPGRGPG